MLEIEDVRCDVVKCIFNENLKCNAKALSISLTHDEMSEKEYLKCDNVILED